MTDCQSIFREPDVIAKPGVVIASLEAADTDEAPTLSLGPISIKVTRVVLQTQVPFSVSGVSNMKISYNTIGASPQLGKRCVGVIANALEACL